ncbi:cobalt ABC transporter permease [Roseospirillum parvum]|uniref:Nickel transport protein n=1 Tax=Roseospirillum parvum TaxID=83401 RepID=A0A1G7VCH4_9PROT|nr:cobalt ABC transporter permease [Roseospirillum parvum]SDG57417.1 nickel transport protein [Roseospirillum parvum]
MRRLLPALLAAAALALAPLPAAAHKVVAAIFATNPAIEGEVGFSNGDMAADIPIEVVDPDGNPLGTTRTDADGVFLFTPTQRVTHVFRADLGAGHVAEITVAADDLPADLGQQAAAPAEGSPAAATAAVPADLDQRIAQAVRAEVKPLRKDLMAFKEHKNLESILGGIGYIMGLFGLGFYLAARRRLNTR